jgi:serine/threonine-protein kinase
MSLSGAEVWLGLRDGARGFRRPVVLKRARHDGPEEAREQLAREARVAAALWHPNVVEVLDCFETARELVLVLEHVRGASLHALLERVRGGGASIPWPVAGRIVSDVARGLAHAHGAVDPRGRPLSIVHRDVTPSNILLADDGRALIGDFGIARSRLSEPTYRGVVKGTPGYLSPEQASDRPLDWRTDVFSLGLVLFELTFRWPLVRAAHVARDLTRLAREGLPPAPDGLPDALHELLRGMLVFERARRTLTMTAVADRLDALVLGRGGSRRDLQLLLEAELGPLLRQRRQRLADLLEGRSSAPVDPRTDGASTIVAVESGLDGGADPLSFSDRTEPSLGAHPLFDDDGLPTSVDR